MNTASAPQHREATLRLAVGCVLLFALALLAHKVWIAMLDPNFGGDAGIRMENAARPIFRLGNRVWLPLLQVHIWLLHFLRPPYPFYNLIPCFYFFAAVVSLGLLGLRCLGRTWSGILFTLAVMFCFAEQGLVSRASTTLYQETLGVAFFYLLLYLGALNLRKAPVLILLGALALLTRDTFQFYLLSLTLLNWKTILSDRALRRSFLFLWCIPVLWLLSIPFGYLVHDGRLPRSLVQWPLMINKNEAAVSNLSMSLASLGVALVQSQAIILLAALVLAWVVIRRHAGRADQTIPGEADFAQRFAPFSLLSLGMIYSAIALFNPTRVTFGNNRMAYPLMEHLFIWAVLALAATFSMQGISRVVARVLVMAGLLASLSPLARTWIPQDNREVRTVYPDLQHLLREASPSATPLVCFGPDDVFVTFSHFIGPTLYAKRRYLPPQTQIPGDCSLWISRPQAVPANTANFARVREYQVRGDSYEVYEPVAQQNQK